ncbi:MAG: hypothetical protein A2086_14590 [Spirochaetes bacterium GWD1_27_9]|nr:MAG: hypothetical protein A2Z98_02705 [Spirochaetes bacterium GWB1_27_13]OHD34092.1 MAG: hypothetical protein A2086_14590 [Spirochaetes bacterium GWD1_27_9]
MKDIKVIIDSPFRNSNLIFASGFYCLDPFVFIDDGNQKTAFLPSTEIEKAKKKSKIDQFFNLNFELERLKEERKYPFLKSSLVLEWLITNEITEIFVPYNFPIIEADNLRNYGIRVYPQEDPFYKQRVSKTNEEIDFIRRNSKKNVAVMNDVKNLLLESDITNDKKLKYKGEILTAEYLQNFIFKKFIDNELFSDTVITAIGNQGCDPHEYGRGEVYANTSIIVDIYPRSRENFYYTDMTRTFCKGKPSDDLKTIYDAVVEAQKLVLDKIYANQNGRDIHKVVQSFFENKGFNTGIINCVLQGFFHGTGHGLGLDCHEMPYISMNGQQLPENSVVSAEPGLYYLDLGAVRIEDLVLVTKNGIENLTNYEKKLELE